MRLERDLFSRWCNLVFRGALGNGPIKNFEDGLDKVEVSEIAYDPMSQCLRSPFFLILYPKISERLF